MAIYYIDSKKPHSARQIENSTKFSNGGGLDSIAIFDRGVWEKGDDLFQSFAVVT